MTTRLQVVEAARKYLGTPFRHQGRVIGRGCDCAGIVLGVAKDLGLSTFSYVAYGTSPHSGKMKEILDEYTVPAQAMQLGSILHMTFDQEPQHLAIVSDIGIIHAYSLVGRCVEHNLDELWRRRIAAIYDFPGIA